MQGGNQRFCTRMQPAQLAPQRGWVRRPAFQAFKGARSCRGVAHHTPPRCEVLAWAADSDGAGYGAGESSGCDADADGDLSESVLERLRKAEKEAADLRYQLTLAKDMQVRRATAAMVRAMEGSTAMQC